MARLKEIIMALMRRGDSTNARDLLLLHKENAVVARWLVLWLVRILWRK